MKGQPHASYDKLSFTRTLDLGSTNKAPEWRDGFKVKTVNFRYVSNVDKHRIKLSILFFNQATVDFNSVYKNMRG